MVTAPVKEAGEVPLGAKIAMTVTTVSDVHRPVLVTLLVAPMQISPAVDMVAVTTEPLVMDPVPVTPPTEHKTAPSSAPVVAAVMETAKMAPIVMLSVCVTTTGQFRIAAPASLPRPAQTAPSIVPVILPQTLCAAIRAIANTTRRPS